MIIQRRFAPIGGLFRPESVARFARIRMRIVQIRLLMKLIKNNPELVLVANKLILEEKK